jgi:hypothetical protein
LVDFAPWLAWPLLIVVVTVSLAENIASNATENGNGGGTIKRANDR